MVTSCAPYFELIHILKKCTDDSLVLDQWSTQMLDFGSFPILLLREDISCFQQKAPFLAQLFRLTVGVIIPSRAYFPGVETIWDHIFFTFYFYLKYTFYLLKFSAVFFFKIIIVFTFSGSFSEPFPIPIAEKQEIN